MNHQVHDWPAMLAERVSHMRKLVRQASALINKRRSAFPFEQHQRRSDARAAFQSVYIVSWRCSFSWNLLGNWSFNPVRIILRGRPFEDNRPESPIPAEDVIFAANPEAHLRNQKRWPEYTGFCDHRLTIAQRAVRLCFNETRCVARVINPLTARYRICGIDKSHVSAADHVPIGIRSMPQVNSILFISKRLLFCTLNRCVNGVPETKSSG
jgi:hypothetical protein